METIKHIIYGDWTYGYEDWRGKPKLNLCHIYFVNHYYALHIGKFWFCVTY